MKTSRSKSPLLVGLALSAFAVCMLPNAQAQELSDDEIKKILIELSIRSYSGNCPCPYNTMRNGRRCGKNSAYSKPGGARPLCYPSDISVKMIEAYRANNDKQ